MASPSSISIKQSIPHEHPRFVSLTFYIQKTQAPRAPGQTEPGHKDSMKVDLKGPFPITLEELPRKSWIITIIPLGRHVDKKDGIYLDHQSISRQHGNITVKYDPEAHDIRCLYTDTSSNGSLINNFSCKNRTVPFREKTDTLGIGFHVPGDPTPVYTLQFIIEFSHNA